MTAATPAWFEEAIADEPHFGSIVVDAVQVRYRYWGESRRGRPDVVLVHGGAAQGTWWDHVGPMIARDRRVIALDLSGHGDSGWRTSYTMDGWAGEVFAVARALSPDSRPVFIGHSMGAAVVMHAAGVLGSRLAGAILIDPLSHDVTSPEAHERTGRIFSQPFAHPTQQAAAQRFRVQPQQATLPFIIDHIASTSVREVAGGWTWKYDPQLFNVERGAPSSPRDIVCALALVHPEHGVADRTASALLDQLVVTPQIIDIAAAAHHVMLDEPLALISALHALLATEQFQGSGSRISRPTR